MAEYSGVFDNLTEYCPPDMTAEAFRAWLLGDVDHSYFKDTSTDAGEFKHAMPKNTSLILAILPELNKAWDRIKLRSDVHVEKHDGLKPQYIRELCELAEVHPLCQFSMGDASKFLAKFVELSGFSVAIGVASVDGTLEFAHKNIVDGTPPEVVYLVYSYYEAPHFIRVDNPRQQFGDKFIGLCVGILGV